MMRLRGQLVCLTEADAEAVRRHLPDHLSLTRAEPGCLTFEVSPTDDPMVWEVMESFRDRASFAAHQARAQSSTWAEATRNCLRNYQVEELGD